MITREKYKEIKEKYGEVGSFAVWAKQGGTPKSNIGDMSVFDLNKNPELLNTLNVNVVMVALNFARDKSDGTLSEPFKNFHDSNPRGQDFKIRYAFEGTPYYGAYMTDIIKNLVMLKSNDVVKHLKDNPGVIAENIKVFEKELEDIGAQKPVILAFGKDTYRILKENLNPEVYSKLIKLTHYSHQIGKEKYREKMMKEVASQK